MTNACSQTLTKVPFASNDFTEHPAPWSNNDQTLIFDWIVVCPDNIPKTTFVRCEAVTNNVPPKYIVGRAHLCGVAAVDHPVTFVLAHRIPWFSQLYCFKSRCAVRAIFVQFLGDQSQTIVPFGFCVCAEWRVKSADQANGDKRHRVRRIMCWTDSIRVYYVSIL